MKFHKLTKATTSELCAKYFCKTILSILKFAVKYTANPECAMILRDILGSNKQNYTTVLQYKQAIHRIGPSIATWECYINTYNNEFFIATDLQSLFDRRDRVDRRDRAEINRKDFYAATSDHTKRVILDALNLMILLYNKYQVLLTCEDVTNRAAEIQNCDIVEISEEMLSKTVSLGDYSVDIINCDILTNNDIDNDNDNDITKLRQFRDYTSIDTCDKFNDKFLEMLEETPNETDKQ